MAGTNLTVLSPKKFPQGETEVEHARRRPAWPATIQQDQAAVDQARRELGVDADAHAILRRAKQIRNEQNERRHG